MSKVRTALVVGGGIAGPVTALALTKAGIQATVFEAHPAAADGVGAMLSLAPNGLDALQTIGAAKAVQAIGQPVPRVVIADGSGTQLATFRRLPWPARYPGDGLRGPVSGTGRPYDGRRRADPLWQAAGHRRTGP
jgi:2-polyprenyl-6-methoxyphenol hydroxylase-like FAD-dependent oxidoreductase